MRKGWEIRKLSEVCNKTANIKWQEENGASYEYIDLSSVSRETFKVENTSTVNSINAPSRAKKIVLKNDVIFASTRPTLKRVTIIPSELDKQICSTGFVVLRGKKQAITHKYIYYYLQTKFFMERMGALQRGASYPAVTDSDVKNTQIPIPPLPEQQQIVSILDKAFAAIDKAKANIERNLLNAKELFQSELNQIFSQKGEGWVEKKLGELGTLTSSKRIYKKEYVENGVPFYRSKEIKELAHGKEISLELFITRDRYEEIKSQFGIPQQGDILLTAVGTIGEMHVVREEEEEGEFYFKDGNIMWLKNFKTLDSYYLKYALTSFVEQLKSMSQGSAYSALTIEKLKEYSVPVPSIEKQKEIVQQLNAIQTEQKEVGLKYEHKVIMIDELKKSILQKAFAGELTDSEYNITEIEQMDMVAEDKKNYN